MKVEAIQAAYANAENLHRRPYKEPTQNDAKNSGYRNPESPETINERLRERMGLTPARKTEVEKDPADSLKYEKTVDMDNYYLGKYLNIVV